MTTQQIEDLIPEYTKGFNNLAKYYQKIKLKKRHHFIRHLRNAGFTFKQLKKFEFKLSKKLWNNCLNESERNPGKQIKSFFIFS